MTSALHEQRLDAVLHAIRALGARTILDLGCGDGDLLVRLAADPQIERILGIDISRAALARLQTRLDRLGDRLVAEVEFRQGSMLTADPALAGFDCAVMVETIEHLDPAQLSVLERSVFRVLRPAAAIITTPNADFNSLLGVPPHRFRHPEHRFEWGRAKFRRWAGGVAVRAGYTVTCSDLAGNHPRVGGATQMAVFVRQPSAVRG